MRVPKFHKHIVSEKGHERRGFVEEYQYRKLADSAAGKLWLRALRALGYTYGFRKAELLEMRCKQVDLFNNTVCLFAGETKNGEGRTVTLTEECRLLVTELRREKQSEDYLITRASGEPVKDFRETWELLSMGRGSRACCSTICGVLPYGTWCAGASRKRPHVKFPATRRMPCSRATISCPKLTSGMRPARSRKVPRPQFLAQFIVRS